MRKSILFVPFIAIAMTSSFSSCVDSDKNLFDNSHQAPNPMGDGFVAPDDFHWSMTGTSNVNIEVNDEHYNQIEILNANPFSTTDYHILAKGVAKKGQAFSQEINYVTGTKCLYIRKTDSRKRVSISTWSISDKQEAVTSKAVRANTRNNNIPEKYPEESHDTSGSIELRGNTNWNQSNHYLEANKKYIIKDKFSGEINNTGGYLNGGKFTLFIEGEWIPTQNVIQNANIIVLKGGKINASPLPSFILGDNSTLTIQSGASFTGNNFNLTTHVLVKNFGTINVSSMKDLNTNSILYNAPQGTITVSGKAVEPWEQSIFTKGAIYNFGTLSVQAGNLKINSQDTTCHFYNGAGAIINTPSFIFGGISVNDGTIKANKVSNDNGGNPTFTNNCSLYAKEFFEFGGTSGKVIMNKGVIAGGIEDGKFIAIPSFKCGNSGITIELNNGSMIKADMITIPNVTIQADINQERSLLKATKSISTGWTTKFKGNLDIECPEGQFAKEISPNNPDYTMEKSVMLYASNGSTAIITSCSETIEMPDPTPNPEDPKFPIITTDTQNYTYSYEDQWPVYGDYDMNDNVMIIKERKIYTDKNNKVEKIELSIDLSAVGATKKIGAAIMLDEVQTNSIKYVSFNNGTPKNFDLNDKNIEKRQDYAVIPLFDDAHAALGKTIYEPINTTSGSSNDTNETANIRFTIEFNNSSITPEMLNVNKLNVFILTGGNKSKRREIHVIGYQPTKLAETDIFGDNNDNSSIKKFYASKENLAWGIMVPTNFRWPKEFINLKYAYPKFESWVISGGKENQDWWTEFNNDKVFMNK